MLTKKQLEAELASIEATRKDTIGVTLKTAAAKASEIGNVPTEGGVERSMLMLHWWLGTLARKNGTDADLPVVFDNWYAAYYRQNVPRPREEPSKDRKDTLRQNYAKFYNFGKELPWNTYAAVARVLAERNKNVPQRGGIVNKIKDAHPKTAPTPKELEAFFAEKPKATDEYTPDTELKALCSAVMRFVNMDDHPGLIAALKNKELAQYARLFGELQHTALELRLLIGGESKKQVEKRKPIAAAIAKLPRKGDNVVAIKRAA